MEMSKQQMSTNSRNRNNDNNNKSNQEKMIKHKIKRRKFLHWKRANTIYKQRQSDVNRTHDSNRLNVWVSFESNQTKLNNYTAPCYGHTFSVVRWIVVVFSFLLCILFLFVLLFVGCFAIQSTIRMGHSI